MIGNLNRIPRSDNTYLVKQIVAETNISMMDIALLDLNPIQGVAPEKIYSRE